MDIAFSDLNEDLPIIEEDDSWFYERIEAPKFVDFSAPESSPVDDRSWFCLRFGCDQQHEEFELDPEALHRDFMLRVMAARSPNVKLQRSLNKHHQSLGPINKCPHSAPAKSVNSRTGGTNSVSSIPNYSNLKLKTHPISSLKSTPSTKEEKIKTLISEKKGLMYPRSKGLPAKHMPSKSAKIGNGKVESLNHKDAAKASRRSSSISKLGDICDGMKKLSIDSIKQTKKSMTMKKKIEAVSIQGDVCKATSKVGVKPSRSAKLGNGKVESLKQNDAAMASPISNSTSKYDDICDGMKKLSIDSTKPNKKSVSIQGGVCKAISKVGVKPSRSAKFGNGKMESLKQNDAAKASLISNSTSKYDDTYGGMKKLSLDSIKKNKMCMSVKKKTEAVSVQGQACKAISKLGVENEIADDVVPIISKESNQWDISEEFLKVNEVVPQISKLDNSAEFDDDKENACITRCRKISTTNSESCENSQQKENKVPIKKFKEATLKEKVKRSTAPKPFRLRTDERRIVKEANIERMIQVKSQKENLTTSRHGEIKTKYADSVKNHKNTLGGPRDNTSSEHATDERKGRVILRGPKDDKSKYATDERKGRVILGGPKDDKPKYVISARTTLKGSKDNKSKYVVNGKHHRTNLKASKDDESKYVKGKNLRTTLEGPNDDTSKYVINGENRRRILEGPKDSMHERAIVKEANTKSNIQLKTQKKVPAPLKYNGHVKNQNAIQGKSCKNTLEAPKAKPNLPKAPRVRYVASRFGKTSPSIHKLQPETKEAKVIQNKAIKTGSSIPNTQRVSNVRQTMISISNTQRVSNVRKTVIAQAKVVERNGTMTNAACLKGKRQSVTNRETKFANSNVKG